MIPASTDPRTRELAEELLPELRAFADALVEVLVVDARARAAADAKDEDERPRAA